MDTHKLVKMANEIAQFFEAEPEEKARLDGIAGHLRRFWDPRMRRALLDWFETGGEGLRPSVLQALKAHRAALAPTG
ncbi:MAG: formate dehydrogenase subunit delta [Planctomycetota bacterium]